MGAGWAKPDLEPESDLQGEIVARDCSSLCGLRFATASRVFKIQFRPNAWSPEAWVVVPQSEGTHEFEIKTLAQNMICSKSGELWANSESLGPI